MKPARDRPFRGEVAVVSIIGWRLQEIFAGASRGESKWTMSNAIK